MEINSCTNEIIRVCGVRAMSVLCNIGCNVMRKLLKFIFLRNNRIYAIVCGINHHCELQIPALNEGKQIYRVSTLEAHFFYIHVQAAMKKIVLSITSTFHKETAHKIHLLFSPLFLEVFEKTTRELHRVSNFSAISWREHVTF